jgi:hypothetical protein
MRPRTIPASYAPLFPWLAEQGQTLDTAFIAEFQDLYSRGMDRALGIQETSLDTAVQLHSQVLDLYTDAPWFTPALRNLFESTAQFLAACMELQLKCLSLMVPVSTAASSSASQSQPAAEELESSIEIATGERKRNESVGAQHRHRNQDAEHRIAN